MKHTSAHTRQRPPLAQVIAHYFLLPLITFTKASIFCLANQISSFKDWPQSVRTCCFYSKLLQTFEKRFVLELMHTLMLLVPSGWAAEEERNDAVNKRGLTVCQRATNGAFVYRRRCNNVNNNLCVCVCVRYSLWLFFLFSPTHTDRNNSSMRVNILETDFCLNFSLQYPVHWREHSPHLHLKQVWWTIELGGGRVDWGIGFVNGSLYG